MKKALLFVVIALVLITAHQTFMPPKAIDAEKVKNFGKVDERQIVKELYRPFSVSSYTSNTEEKTYKTDYVVKPGDTLTGILTNFEIPPQDISSLLRSMRAAKERSSLMAGQRIRLEYEVRGVWLQYEGTHIPEQYTGPILHRLSKKVTLLGFETKLKGSLEVRKATRGNGEAFTFITKKLVPITEYTYAESAINTSLYVDLISEGVEPGLIEEYINLFSFDIDFQRDIRKNDTFKIYGVLKRDPETREVVSAKVLYAHLGAKVHRKNFEYYRFKGMFYDIDGKASVKSFLRTPVPGARLTSNFGYRKHPILGYSKLHAGTDFAAPKGTPVYAAADGTITFRNWNGSRRKGYGRYIKIKHNSTYTTAYAHLSRFQSGLGAGSRVRRGQVIGYVGSTGYSTGPHLHYEVHKNGKKIDPKRVTSFSVGSVKKSEKKAFEQSVNEVKLQVKALKAGKQVEESAAGKGQAPILAKEEGGNANPSSSGDVASASVKKAAKPAKSITKESLPSKQYSRQQRIIIMTAQALS